MNIRWIVLFNAVAQEGSFTRAAARLNVAQPWVSAQIRKLELELGVDLLERTAAGVEVTREGRELLPFASQVAEGTRKFRDVARTLGDVRNKVVRVGSHVAMIELEWLYRLNIDYQRRYANFSIETQRAGTPELLGALDEGSIDCAACLGPIADEDERYEILTVAAVRPYLLAKREESGMQDAVAGVTIATPDRILQPAYFDPLFALWAARGATLRRVPEAGRAAMEHHVRRQGGVVLMVEGDAAAYTDDPQLVAKTLDIVPAVTFLLRLRKREPGRAATRYWELAADAAPLND